MKRNKGIIILLLACLMVAGCGQSDFDAVQGNKVESEQERNAENQQESTSADETATEQEQEKSSSKAVQDVTWEDEVQPNAKEAEEQETEEQKAEDQMQDTESTQISEAAGQNDSEAEATSDMETKILVYKADRKLELWQNGELAETYPIGLGKKPEGKKEKEGDKKTPEGEYYVCARNQYSKFYLSLGVSYPNIEDAKAGLESGLIDQSTYDKIESAILNGECPPWNTALGGEIMIHGHGSSNDWTLGCIAVEDEVMDVLWESCAVGTRIVIYP
ncbi:L,D-transpeptidase family protein [Konateibacter massiliensis]|uniref:L,D-transpeptidase family protein n=1 Tax=Konateibacter massiliensis TaxID=2002841 RepID=UPI000C14B739|nr:L,D-transpeptidase family protein [Konateibacter massiliensis]